MENPEDAIPRINWGKYVERDGRWMLNITLTPNHRFIDGYHIGLFFQILQEEINRL
jgi:chloramphenicol O-acetyltransferase